MRFLARCVSEVDSIHVHVLAFMGTLPCRGPRSLMLLHAKPPRQGLRWQAVLKAFVGAPEDKTTLREALRGCDLVTITAGVARKPGMTRDDLFAINASIVKGAQHRAQLWINVRVLGMAWMVPPDHR